MPNFSSAFSIAPLPTSVEKPPLRESQTPNSTMWSWETKLASLLNEVGSDFEKLKADLRKFATTNLGVGDLPRLRVEYDWKVQPHPHGSTRQHALEEFDFYSAVYDLLQADELGAADLNLHIPLELQFHDYAGNAARAWSYVDSIQKIAERLDLLVVWENVPFFNTSNWTAELNSQTIPLGIPLCLDTGHLMLGSANQTEALKRVDAFLETYGHFVKHLHLHINDFVSDQHNNNPLEVIEFFGTARFRTMTANRSYIFEKGL